jgi:metal-responsive CopG/Arc/MetJ family transcriptional regulator
MPDTPDKQEQVRVHVIFDADEVQAIDDYSFTARIRTRSEAIRTLIKKALEGTKGEG